MEKKVFVLVCDWGWNEGGYGKEVSVYDTIDAARAAMASDSEEWKSENPTISNCVIEESDDYISIYADGFYNTAHIDWTIYEKEVKNTKKQEGKDLVFIKANALLYDEDATWDELTHILAEMLEKFGKPISLNDCGIEVDHCNGECATCVFLMLSGGNPLVIVETENCLHYDFSTLAIFRQKKILKEVLKSLYKN